MNAECLLKPPAPKRKPTTITQVKIMLFGWAIIIALLLLTSLISQVPKDLEIIHMINDVIMGIDAIACAIFIILSAKWIMYLDFSIDRTDSYIAVFDDYVEIKQTIGRFKTVKQTVEIPYDNMEEWKLCDSLSNNSTRVNCLKIKLNQPMDTINAKNEIVTTNEFTVLMAGYDKVEFMDVRNV